jgi:integration host factor subunit alpha
MTLTKSGLVDSVYNKLSREGEEVTKRESSEYVDTVIETVKQTLEKGEEVKLSGFGKFEVRHKDERLGRNPRTGEEIMIPERKVVRYKISGVFKDDLNDE